MLYTDVSDNTKTLLLVDSLERPAHLVGSCLKPEACGAELPVIPFVAVYFCCPVELFE
jgi:hypothetical protein